MKIKMASFILISVGVFFGFYAPTNSFAIQLRDTSQYIDALPSQGISMDFKEAALNDVLKVFSQQSGMNFITAQNVSQIKISLYLDNVPVDEALERILSANNLTYEITPGSNIFLVKLRTRPEVQTITRVYPLKYASVPSAAINSSSSSSSSSATSGAASSGTSSSGSGLISTLQSLLTKDGKIQEDSRTNSLIITDIPDVFPIIEQTIARLDIRVPLILIEAEMLDVSKGTSDKIGVKWGANPMTFSGASKNTYAPLDKQKILDIGPITTEHTAATEFEKGYDTITKTFLYSPSYTAGTLSFAGLQFALQFLHTQTDTKNLARPRILTLNNQQATIQISTDETIGTKTTESTSTTSGNTLSIEAERASTGVFLTVTPQANVQTKEITLSIEPKAIQARKSDTFATFNDVETRSTKSLLRVKDGDTVIIGGLLRDNQTSEKTSVPILSKIPFIGNAFKHKDNIGSQRELIVFITPHIVQEDISEPGVGQSKKIVREQDNPSTKSNAINKEMAVLKTQRSNF